MPTTHELCSPRMATITLGSRTSVQGYLLRMIDDTRAVILLDEKEIIGTLVQSSPA